MMRAVTATAQLVIRDALCVQAGAADVCITSVPAADLARIAESVPRARLERAAERVDDVRRALGQPISVALALAAVYARVAQARRREAVPA